MIVTPINKTIGYQLKALTVNADNSIVAQYSVGSIDEAGTYKAIAERSYLINAVDSGSVLNVPAIEGIGVFEQLTAALSDKLSLRADWIA